MALTVCVPRGTERTHFCRSNISRQSCAKHFFSIGLTNPSDSQHKCVSCTSDLVFSTALDGAAPFQGDGLLK